MLSLKMQGSALLTALFIMTLVAIVATAMSLRIQLDLYRTQLLIGRDKLYLASEEISFWGISLLADKDKLFTKAVKNRVAFFPKKKDTEGIINLSGALYDLQAGFNLNNLIEKKAMNTFLNLLHQAVPQLNIHDQFSLTLALQEWVAPYDLSRGKSPNTSYYLAQKPPYYQAHLNMSSISELRLIKDVDDKLFEALSPYISALPENTPINLNTAPPKVLQSLGNGISAAQIEEIISVRDKQGIKDSHQLNELSKKVDLPLDQITIKSQYFLSVAQASTQDLQLTVYTLLKRNFEKDGSVKVGILRKSINGF